MMDLIENPHCRTWTLVYLSFFKFIHELSLVWLLLPFSHGQLSLLNHSPMQWSFFPTSTFCALVCICIWFKEYNWEHKATQHTPTQGSPKGGPQHDQRKSLKPQDPSSDPTRNSWSFEALAMHHILNFSAIFLRRSGMHGWSFSPYVFLLASIEPPWSTLHTIGKE